MTNLFYLFSKADAPVYFPGASFFVSSLLCIASAILIYMGLKQKQAKTGNI